MARPSFLSPLRAVTSGIRDSWTAPYIEYVFRGWKTIITYALIAGAAGAGVALMLPRLYVSRATMVAETPDRPSISGSLAQFAGQFGVMGLTGTRSPEFYLDLLHSVRTLSALATTSIIDPVSGKSEPIYRVYTKGKIDSLTPRNRERVIRLLRSYLNATVDNRTAVIRVSLGGPSGTVASATLDSLLALANRFAVTQLMTRAQARRQFAEGQTTKAGTELREAEENLRRFHERNRRLTDSPALQLEEAILRRRVDLRQELFVGLSRELEQARLDEVRDTPILNLIDSPSSPTRHERPNRPALTILATIFGGLAAVAGLVIDRSHTLKRPA